MFLKSSIFLTIRGVPPTSAELSETSKIKKIIISESREQRQKYLGTFIYALSELTKP